MKKVGLLILIVLLFNASCKNGKINTLTDEEIKEGWKLLFDGVSMNGWRFFKGGDIAGWKVKDGILYNSGKGSDHGGDIITKDTYQDFELYLEWKTDTASNSGIFYHVQEPDSIHAIYESGPEYQLIDDAYFPRKLQKNQYSGANYAMHDPIGAKVKPLDQWNESRIIVKGTHVEHWLNGTKVVEYELWTDEWFKRKNAGKWKDAPYYGMAKDGHIGLQDHGGLTMFRNIKIRRL
jgi:hypothetical protein